MSSSKNVLFLGLGAAAGAALYRYLYPNNSSAWKQILSEKSCAKWKGRHVLSVNNFTREDLDELFRIADQMDISVTRQGTMDLCKDSLLTCLFYEPSTRTRCSFQSAMLRLGGKVVVIADAMKQSSVKKGETIQDTISSLQSYSDVIAMRHPKQGSAAQGASVARVPILNGGDGPGEHPTQALLDAYTIYKHLGRVDGLTITLVGDLKYGRTTHSLAKLLTQFDNITLNYVSPPSLAMPEEFIEYVSNSPNNITQKEYSSLDDVLATSDVIYMTRVQKERFQNPADYEKVKNSYVLDLETCRRAKDGVKIMHPLPRITEIATDVDEFEGAIYFDQMRCGMILRMALIAAVLGKA